MAPVFYAAWNSGIAPRRFISDVTGLSETRLANSGQALRPKRLASVQQHADEKLRELLRSRDYPEVAIKERLKGQAQVKASGGGVWALHWYGEEFPHAPQLSGCVDVGLRLDSFLAAAEQAIARSDLAGFCEACAVFVERWALPADVATKCSVVPPESLRDAQTWNDALTLAQNLLLAAFLDQFAQFDAVWSSLYAQVLRPRSLVALISPTQRGKTGLNRPVRRLLVLCYALHFWVRHKRWPHKEPSRAEIAEKLPSWSPQDVANLFDGSKRLTYAGFEGLWSDMACGFKHDREVNGPHALARIALAWQRQLVTVGSDQKLRSFIILGEDYHGLWEWRRSQLPHASQGTIEWPLWLRD
ncbi:hypothetical protein ACSFA0_14665 [Variovorax sp. LT1P1]|uniref:hypothetical protein n=1 Tax=Variovorax sp. LT1P1 TaxID=3443730 RepID=UPI003F466F9D